MDGSTFFVVCGIIITIGSVATALCTIYNLLKNPAKKLKERHDQDLKDLIVETIKDVLPGLLKNHDKEVKEIYKADRERYLREIKASVLEDTRDELAQVKILGIQYESLMISARDVLREKIIKIFNDNKDERKLHILDRERLDQFYKDYKALNGNSYIDKYYNRMKNWKVIDDDYDDDAII